MGWKFWGTAAAAGLVLGVGATWGVIATFASFGTKDYGGWKGSESAGSADADIYTRALIARSGLLALTRKETIYFTRYTDAGGAVLDGRCAYALEGVDLPARWWSVTLYADDNYLAVNGDNAPSMDKTRVQRNPDKTWRIDVSPTAKNAVNWVSSKNGRAFSLTIRMYNPDPAAVAKSASIVFPTLRKISCEGGAA